MLRRDSGFFHAQYHEYLLPIIAFQPQCRDLSTAPVSGPAALIYRRNGRLGKRPLEVLGEALEVLNRNALKSDFRGQYHRIILFQYCTASGSDFKRDNYTRRPEIDLFTSNRGNGA